MSRAREKGNSVTLAVLSCNETLINRDIHQRNQMAGYVSSAFNNPWKDFSFLNTSLMILNTFPHSTMQHMHCMVLIHQMNHAQMPRFIILSQKSPYESNVPREFHAPTANLISAYLYNKPKQNSNVVVHQ